MSINSFDELPDHIIAAMSHAERNYHRALLDGPHIGAGFITSHRQLEARMADLTTRNTIANYFPEVALSTFESFAETHYRREPTKGHGTESTMSERVRLHYSRLFRHLRTRLQALFEIPQFSPERTRFELIEELFFADLDSAERLARKLTGKDRVKGLHTDYRRAFANIQGELHALLHDLVSIGQAMNGR